MTASGEGYEPRFVYPDCLVFTVFGCETQFVIVTGTRAVHHVEPVTTYKHLAVPIARVM